MRNLLLVMLIILSAASIMFCQPAKAQVTLHWTATGDDGSGGGPATRYDVRYSTSPINNLTDFANATRIDPASLADRPWHWRLQWKTKGEKWIGCAKASPRQ